jgi:hypothetical protein
MHPMTGRGGAGVTGEGAAFRRVILLLGACGVREAAAREVTGLEEEAATPAAMFSATGSSMYFSMRRSLFQFICLRSSMASSDYGTINLQ